MILVPDMIPDIPGLSDSLFPVLDAGTPDTSAEPEDSPRRVNARAAIERLQAACADSTAHTIASTVDTQFSQQHSVFGAHMATRTVSAPAGALIVGAVHKYPTLNILTKGRVLMASEHGKRMLVAPCMYMQDANVKKAGWVLEDCTLTNVVLTPTATDDPVAAERVVRDFHTAANYADLGILAAAAPPRIEGA